LLFGLCAIAFIIAASMITAILACILEGLQWKDVDLERYFDRLLIVFGIVFVLGFLSNLTAFIAANTMIPSGFGYSTAMHYLIVLLSIESLVFLPIIVGIIVASLEIAFSSLQESLQTRRARAKHAVFPGNRRILQVCTEKVSENKQESGALPTATTKPIGIPVWALGCEVIEDNQSVSEANTQFNNV
jgi:hypothetical protein